MAGSGKLVKGKKNEAFPVQHRMRSLMTKACDPGRLFQSIYQTLPLHSSLIPLLIELTGTERVGNEEMPVKIYSRKNHRHF